MRFSKLFGIAATVAVTMGAASAAQAGVIVSPVSAVINSGGPGFGSIADTYNHNGLLSGFVSGVTDFNTYIGTNPQHSLVFAGNEWFGNSGTTSASVTYDLGSVLNINAMALWNEESSGIGRLDIFTSLDNITFGAVTTFFPPNNPIGSNYGPSVIGNPNDPTGTNLRYVRLDMSNCPQAEAGSFPACAIGEVAFDRISATVPEPITLSLFGTGLAGAIAMRRRKKTAA